MSQNNLSNEQVLKVTSEVFARTTGTLQDHQVMQACLQVIEQALAQKKDDEVSG